MFEFAIQQKKNSDHPHMTNWYCDYVREPP